MPIIRAVMKSALSLAAVSLFALLTTGCDGTNPALTPASTAARRTPATKPNIILIVSDDLGYGQKIIKT